MAEKYFCEDNMIITETLKMYFAFKCVHLNATSAEVLKFQGLNWTLEHAHSSRESCTLILLERKAQFLYPYFSSRNVAQCAVIRDTRNFHSQ